MKLLTLLAALCCWCGIALSADINITNVTKAATIPPGSFALGQTGLVTRLLPMDQVASLTASQTFSGSNIFSLLATFNGGVNIPGTMTIGTISATSGINGNASGLTNLPGSSVTGAVASATSATTATLATTATGATNDDVGRKISTTYAPLAGTNTFTGTNIFTVGTRTFSHDGNHTLITNTATLTASEWTAGSQKEWYNGTATMTIDKTNGIVTGNNFVTPTNTALLSVDMNVDEGTWQTNGVIVVAGYINLSTITYQHKMLHFYYTGFGQSSAIALTFPANTHVQGTANYTNQTDVQLDYDPKIPITNALCLPRW